jgi:hypothetical protein
LRNIFMAAAAFAASPALAAPATPAQLELETWRAFQAGQVKQFESMFAPSFVGVYADGTHDFAREMQVIHRVKIDGFRLSPIASHAVDGDDVLLTYTATVHDTVNSKPASARLRVASLWHLYGGRWLCVYHTEIKAK